MKSKLEKNKLENLLEMAVLLHGVDRLAYNVQKEDSSYKVHMDMISESVLLMAKNVINIVIDDQGAGDDS